MYVVILVDNYKLFIANMMCNIVDNSFKNKSNVTNDMILTKINSCISDLNLDMDEWMNFIFESLKGNKSNMNVQQALAQYGYENAAKSTSNPPTFAQVWLEIMDFINYFNISFPENIFIGLEDSVDNLTKNSMKKEYSWDKRVVARTIVKKGYNNALKVSSIPDDNLIKKETFKILNKMCGFENPGLLFAVRDLLEDKFYNEELLGKAFSKVAIEDMIRFNDPNNFDMDLSMWIDFKLKLIQDLGCLNNKEFTDTITRTNYRGLFLEYISALYNNDKAVSDGFIVDVGNRSYGFMIDQNFLLKIIYSTAKFEARFEEDQNRVIDVPEKEILYRQERLKKLKKLEDEKIRELLKYFGWQNDPRILAEMKRIDSQYNQKVLDRLRNGSLFDF